MLIKSAEEFEDLNAFNKGYYVYMLGEHEGEPFVPKEYFPDKKNKKRYNEGQWEAMLEAQDSEE